MLKRWRDTNSRARTPISSILLTTLIGPYVPVPTPSNPDAYVIVRTLQGLRAYVGLFTVKPVVLNPALPSEDLASEWTQSDYNQFRVEVSSASVIAERAYAATNEIESARLWQSMFGEDFPLY